MNTSSNALAFALLTAAVAAPAAAQYVPQQEQTTIRAQSGSASKQKEEEALPQAIPGSGPVSTTGRKLDISKGAQKAIIELQNAVNANDTASIPAKLAAAQAVAKTNDDKFVIASNQTKAALAAGDLAAIRVGIEAMQASGSADPSDIAARFTDLGQRHLKAGQQDQAASALDRALSIDPAYGNALLLLADVRAKQNRKAEAIALMQKAIAAARAAGRKPKEGDYKFAARLAYDSRSPAVAEITRAWVTDYPTADSVRDALRIYRDLNRPEGDLRIDTMRLARAAGALKGEADYHGFATALVAKGHLAEAKALLDEGAAAKAIDVKKQAFKDVAAKLTKVPTRAAADAAAKAALAGGSAQAALAAGDALYGHGAFAEAANLYRAAAERPGADKNLANLRLGIALARAGDKAGATAAFSAVGGAQAEVAKYWLAWLSSRA